MFTHYEILNISSDASLVEIRNAYIRLARENHPDKNRDIRATEAFQNIQAAYELLSNAVSRKQYDVHLQQSKRSVPIPNPLFPGETSELDLDLHPDKLPARLVASIDLNSPEFLNYYFRKYSAKQLGAVLVKACSMGKLRIVHAIIEKFPALLKMDISAFYNDDIVGNCSILFPAVRSGNVELLMYLITKGLSVDEVVKKYHGYADVTPLGFSVICNLHRVCSALVLYSDFKKNAANHILLAAFQNENAQIASILMEAGLIPDDHTVLLRLAIEKRHYQLVALLCHYTHCDYKGGRLSAASAVIAYFGYEKIKELIDDGILDPLAKLKDESSLDLACQRLFRAMGRSSDIRILDLLCERFENVKRMLSSKDFQEMILLGALEKSETIPATIKFHFCRAFLERHGLPKKLRHMQEVAQAVKKRGGKFLALFQGYT